MATPKHAAIAQTRLVEEIEKYAHLTVAVSGGIDSMVLAYVAHGQSRAPAAMIHAVSPAVPPTATARVKSYAQRYGWQLRVVEAGEFSDPDYLANPVNRCYFCKTNLYDRIGSLAAGPIASGANLDDLGDFRPGLKAAAEHQVVHPFVNAGIDKATIRALAQMHELTDIAELPAQPCLASRVETGIGINSEDLIFIDHVEQRLRRDFSQTSAIRCRITRAGVVIEVGEGVKTNYDVIAATVAPLCAREDRSFAGVMPYRQGSAFLHQIDAAKAIGDE